MTDSPRRKARELALKCLYAYEAEQSDIDEIIVSIVESSTLSKRNSEFAASLVRLVIEHGESIDNRLSQLARHWSLKRMAGVDRNILRLAVAELQFLPDVPVKVVINEAIELARLYSTGESSSFVNGILDSFVKQEQEKGQI
jgi:N utilization substance protein B